MCLRQFRRRSSTTGYTRHLPSRSPCEIVPGVEMKLVARSVPRSVLRPLNMSTAGATDCKTNHDSLQRRQVRAMYPFFVLMCVPFYMAACQQQFSLVSHQKSFHGKQPSLRERKRNELTRQLRAVLLDDTTTVSRTRVPELGGQFDLSRSHSQQGVEDVVPVLSQPRVLIAVRYPDFAVGQNLGRLFGKLSLHVAANCGSNAGRDNGDIGIR